MNMLGISGSPPGANCNHQEASKETTQKPVGIMEPSFVLYALLLDPGCCLRAHNVLIGTAEPAEPGGKNRRFWELLAIRRQVVCLHRSFPRVLRAGWVGASWDGAPVFDHESLPRCGRRATTPACGRCRDKPWLGLSHEVLRLELGPGLGPWRRLRPRRWLMALKRPSEFDRGTNFT